ncbi:DUF4349 domain-containing protein [Streptomyces galbus]|uniref:DUF4349 domain-containing protein n=1 Tax=Streptomyces galbus TaxID=33898 RepID=A0A4U5X637_STRGB|nr:DUF4349 domain-containing protein [Streptomyces galbus]TKT10658.1 DUF4349 domain-containing protein [Streptomyces galbus]GHD21431.1 hypothetical protein GCM10010335_01400 [Streptomyces galbus]
MRTRRSVRDSAPAPSPARGPARPRVRLLAGLLLAASVALAGCGGGDSGASSGSADKAAVGQDQAGEYQGAQDGAADEKAAGPGGGSGAKSGAGARATAPPALPGDRIIRTASLTVRVADVPRALDRARTATEGAGGYVGDETTTRDEHGVEHTRVVLRVPVGNYETVLTALQGTGTLLERTAKAQDVTDQVVDVDSRVASQRAGIARVRELMGRATKLSDVLLLEGELNTRETELESLLARQAALKDRTDLATVTLTLAEKPEARADRDDGPGLLDALAGGWGAFVTMLRWLVTALAAVLPFAALALVVGLVARRVLRSRRAARRPASTPPPVPPTHPGPTLPAHPAGPGQEGGRH